MDNLRGIALIITAMAGFAIMDMFVKFATRDLPVGQILAIIGTSGGCAFALMTRAQGHKVISRDFLYPVVIIRNLSEIISAICYVTALSLIDLSTASAVFQASPLVVTLGAIIILREKVRWQRWSAIIVGLCGVVIILHPTADSFQPAALWALAGMFTQASRDLSTRMIPPSVPTLRISTYGMAMLLPAGLLLLIITPDIQPMQAFHWLQLGGAVSFGVLSYWAITEAMRIGEVSVISAYRYTRILFALLIGIIIFGETPDLWMIVGASITVVAGIYAFIRESKSKATLSSKDKAK